MRMFAQHYCRRCDDQTLHRWNVEVDDTGGLTGRPERCCQCGSLTYSRVGTIGMGPKPGSFTEDFVDFRRGTTGGDLAALLTLVMLAGGIGFLFVQIALGVATGRW